MMKKILVILGVILLLGIGWYGLSPLFMNQAVDDAVPMASAPSEPPSTSDQVMPERRTETAPILSERVSIVATIAHPASGFVRVVTDGTSQYLRYEDYKTINGPDVRVYLATDTKAKDFVDLGVLRGTEGNINYPIPAGTDLSKYRYALTWCEDFSVLFNSAELSR
jgi:hypothetical protein